MRTPTLLSVSSFALLLFVGVFVYSSPVSAATLYSQTNFASSTASSTINNSGLQAYKQSLGTGLFGSVTGIKLYHSISANTHTGVSLYECPTSSSSNVESTCAEIFQSYQYGRESFPPFDVDLPESGGALVDYPINLDEYPLGYSTLDSTKYYWIRFSSPADAGTAKMFGSAASSYANGQPYYGGLSPTSLTGQIGDFYFELYGGSYCGASCIESVTPSDLSTVSTSSPVVLGASGTLADQADSAYIRIHLSHVGSTVTSQLGVRFNPISPVGSTCLVGFQPFFCLLGGYGTSGDTQVDLAVSSGYFDVSTSTPTLADTGRWTMETSIRVTRSFFGVDLLYPDRTITSTTTTFIYGQKSFADGVLDNFASTTAAATNSSSAALVSVYCNILSGFDMSLCLSALLLPSNADWQLAFQNIYNALLGKWPLGYVTRGIAILSSTNQSTLPPLVFSLPSNANLPGGVPGSSITLTPWVSLMGTSSYMGSATSVGADPKTFRQIVEPGWKFFVYFAFGVLVVAELLGFMGRLDVQGVRRDMNNNRAAADRAETQRTIRNRVRDGGNI